jgi:dynein heavy chain
LLTQENAPKGGENDEVVLETYFVFAAIWAFGSAFSITDGCDYKKNFSSWFKNKWTTVKLPAKGQVFDFFIEKGTLKWVAWAHVVDKIEYSSTTSMDSVTVSAIESLFRFLTVCSLYEGRNLTSCECVRCPLARHSLFHFISSFLWH